MLSIFILFVLGDKWDVKMAIMASGLHRLESFMNFYDCYIVISFLQKKIK